MRTPLRLLGGIQENPPRAHVPAARAGGVVEVSLKGSRWLSTEIWAKLDQTLKLRLYGPLTSRILGAIQKIGYLAASTHRDLSIEHIFS